MEIDKNAKVEEKFEIEWQDGLTNQVGRAEFRILK